MGDYTSIIEALEGAKEGSRELDVAVAVAAKWWPRPLPVQGLIWRAYLSNVELFKVTPNGVETKLNDHPAPALSTSLDTALTLVREKMPGANIGMTVHTDAGSAWVHAPATRMFGSASTSLPIALLIALFTALQAKEAKTDE